MCYEFLYLYLTLNYVWSSRLNKDTGNAKQPMTFKSLIYQKLLVLNLAGQI